MTKISIVIPAKNEVSSITSVVEGVRATLDDAEIIVVCDGSEDGTGQAALRVGARVIFQPYSMGNGAAIKMGAREASGDVLVFMDADGQHRPEDIPRLLERLGEKFDMVVGARQAGTQASIWRGIANSFYNWLASYMTGHKIDDLTSGFRVARAQKFREFLYMLPNGFSYPTTSTMAFFRAGYSVAYEPIYAARRIGKSHINPFRDGARFLLIIFKIGTLYSPLKLFLPIAIFHWLLGILYYAYSFLTSGRLSLATIFLMGSGVTIFLIGLVSEQITQLAYKDNGRGGN